MRFKLRGYMRVLKIALGIMFILFLSCMTFAQEQPKESLFWKKLSESKVQCMLCPFKCVLKNKQVGVCQARQNIDGTLYSLTYGKPVALHSDPIEKKTSLSCLSGNIKLFYCYSRM